MSMLSSIDLHPLLRERISCHCPDGSTSAVATSTSTGSVTNRLDAVLYLPTVVLRYEHNPAFCLACHIANALDVPVLVLAVIPDDTATPRTRANVHAGVKGKPIAMTARRLAFHMEALSSVVPKWRDHGAAVAVRVHGSGCRTPDHLTLARRCRFVVTDEPFVDPYLGLVQKVENACRSAKVQCIRVDGSTTVPPASMLRKIPNSNAVGIMYDGVPAKAWMWQKKTDPKRPAHVQAAIRGHFDAPPLAIKIRRERFFQKTDCSTEGKSCDGNDDHDDDSFLSGLPSSWRDPNAKAPGVRPWTAKDIDNLQNIKDWSLSWQGADSSVPPSPQTSGTSKAGMTRWNTWIARNGLADYGRRRNDPLQPHASSRMSCYLNLGVVSIFRLVHEVLAAEKKNVAGASKFIDEIIKWREGAYLFTFARTDYSRVGAVPQWAREYLERTRTEPNDNSSTTAYGLDVQSLALGNTFDDKWNSFQQYLVRTGEMHNNVRMSWGKTIMSWTTMYHYESEEGCTTSKVLQILCFLNDRYALDGLSPPSYGGLLWCLGWGDKPSIGGAISPKPASKYKYGPEDFRRAESILLGQRYSDRGSGTSTNMQRNMSQGSLLDMMATGRQRQNDRKPKRQRSGDDQSPPRKLPGRGSTGILPEEPV